MTTAAQNLAAAQQSLAAAAWKLRLIQLRTAHRAVK